jgi:hypothetical protein
MLSIDYDACDTLLNLLTVTHVLRRMPDGTYVGYHSAH